MAEAHRQPPFPLRIKDQAARKWVKQTAAQMDRSQNWVINNLIKEAMRHDQQATAQK